MKYCVKDSVCLVLLSLPLGACALKLTGTLAGDALVDATTDFSDTDAMIEVIDGAECPEGLTPCPIGCVDIMADRNNCGGCGAACEDVETCVDGGCVCNTGEGNLDCGGICVDPRTDSDHCGSCEIACSDTAYCSAGSCTCPGLPDRMRECGGVCVNIFTDSANCGSCGNVCSGGMICNGAGVCDMNCTGDYTECGTKPDTYCADLSTDPQHCGACDYACPSHDHAIAGCESSACTWTCEPEWVDRNSNADDGCECHVSSTTEICNAIDDNCNNEIDETFACVQNTTLSCPKCGTQVCDSFCSLGVCYAGGVCDPSEAPQTQTCCSSGSQTRFCQPDCNWSDWGDCSTGLCTPTRTETQTCCLTGTQSRTCQTACTWGPWDRCSVGAGCTPGELDTETCCSTGNRTRTCLDDCTWTDWSSCSVGVGCFPGTSEELTCCLTGRQSRSCQANCTWTDWSSCSIGECTPGSRRCSNYNYNYEVCQDSCFWGGSTSCGHNPDYCCNPSDGSCFLDPHPC